MKARAPLCLSFLSALCLIIAGCATRQNIASTQPLKPDNIAQVHSDNEAQTKFGIFLAANPNLDTRPGMVDLAHVQLASSPAISADDIVSYDFSTHAMKLTDKAFKRVPHPPVRGLPFVVVANGERIYLGAFWTEISSMSSDVPTITVNKGWLDKGQPKNIQVIDRAYPTDSFGKGPDPRSDPRIKNALASLHKLK